MDTGWLLVGAAGICGGLALALVGAGVATSPLLIPLGALVGLAGYFAWVVGSSRVVATVYEEVGDPERNGGPIGGHRGRHDPQDPDGNWGTAADGGRTASESGDRTVSDDSPGFDHGPGSAAGSGSGGDPSVDDIWDARERDRVGGWDDWEWADRHWREFEREYDIDGSDPREDRTGRATGGDDRADRRNDRSDRDHGARSRRRRTHSRAREDSGTRTGEDDRRSGHRGRRRTTPGDGDPGDDRRTTDSRTAGAGERTTGRRGRGSRGGRQRKRSDRQAARARDLLGVDREADEAAIRSAYRERAKETHPDRDGDPEAFKRVQWAYEYLTGDR